MFKKLKDKIAEDLKFSPQRLTQQQPSANERNQSSNNDDNFFSIAEDDTGASFTSSLAGDFQDIALPGSTPMEQRNRKLSNSSMASDISFLPRYEPAGSFYHMQSDLDISASEVEDNASTSSQLGHISKEQVYAAFQKAQLRYHKYRGRYTDLANHYKILEKENGKIKTILVETQDKAIRRVNELKEQCALEQKAKAHLENALRVELDERQIKIETLQTKIKLLQNGAEKSDLLVDITDNRTSDNSRSTSTSSLSEKQGDYQELTKYLNDARAEIENLNEKLQEMKANTIIFNTKEADYKQKISALDKLLQERNSTINQYSEREKENNLKLAQSKMELHAEIHNKDLEIANLKKDLDNLRHEMDKNERSKNNIRLENLQSQNAKMIDKIETLNQKCSNYEAELIKLEQYKIEIGNLNEIVLNLKKINEELIQKKLQSETEIKNEYDRKVTELQKEYDECKEKFETSIAENEDLKTKFAENEVLYLKIEEITAKNTDLSTQNVELISQFEVVKKKNEELLQKVEEIQRRNENLNEELQEEKLKYQDATEKVREDTKQSLLMLESKIKEKFGAEFAEKESNIKKEFETKLKNLLESTESSKQIEVELMQANDRLKILDVANSRLRSDLNEQKVKYKELENNHLDLINESNQTRRDLSVLEKENTSLRDDLSSLEAEIQSLREEINKSDEKLALERNENQKLFKEVESLRINESSNEILAEKAEEIDKLKTAIREKDQELLATIEMHENELYMKTSEYKVLQTEFSLLQEVSTKQQNDNCLLQEDKRNLASEIEEYGSNMKALKKEIEEIQLVSKKSNEIIEVLKKDNLKLVEEAKNYATAQSDCEKIIEHLKSDNEKVSTELEARKNEILKLETMIEEQSQSIKDLKHKNQNITMNLVTEKNELLQKLTETQEEQERVRQDKLNSESEMAELHKTIKELKQYESQYQKLVEENNNLKEQNLKIEELQSKLERLEAIESDFERTTKEKHTISKDLEITEKQKQEILSENKKLKQEIIQLKVGNERIQDLEVENMKLKENISQLQSQINSIIIAKQNLNEELTKNTQIQTKYNDVLNECTEFKNKCLQLTNENMELFGRNHQLTLDYKQILHENERNINEYAELKMKYEETEMESVRFEDIKQKLNASIADLNVELQKYKSDLAQARAEKNNLEKLQSSTIENTENQTSTLKNKIKQLQDEKSDYESLFNEYKQMKTEINNIKQAHDKCLKEKKEIEHQLGELERHYSEITHEKQLLKDEIQELKISPLNLMNKNKSDSTETQKTEKKFNNDTNYSREVEGLREKLEQYKSIDKANRASIEFYEGELQKLKVKNEKLSRKLDDTLVTLPVLTGSNDLGDSHAKLEYLRNVLFNYMIGKENIVLAKVIAAVCKFDKDQTELIMQKEQQRQTLLGQLFGS